MPAFRLVPETADERGAWWAPAPEHVALRAFADTQPPELVRVMAPFRSHQWLLLLLWGSSDAARELCEAEPVLAYLLAQVSGSNAQQMAHALPVRVDGPRLLASLSLPATKRARRALRKVDPGSMDRSFASLLVKALRSDEPTVVKPLSHAPHITKKLLMVLADRGLREQVGATLLEELVARGDDAPDPCPVRQMREIASMRRAMGQRGPRSITSLRRLAELHAETERDHHHFLERQRAAEAQRERLRHARFHRPPVPGRPGAIEPLTTAGALLDEGMTMQHCVGSYVEDVFEGGIYIYRVLRPERATLAITRGDDEGWRLAQLQGPRNHPVRADTRRAVEDWLEPYRFGD